MALKSDYRILFIDDDGNLNICCPAEQCSLTLEETALKDVPTGKKYKIVSKDDIPTDWSFRNAWTVDEADLSDGVGA